jgi:hypothetical protein
MSSNYRKSLDTWTVVQMTAAKIKPFIFRVCGFALSNIAHIFIFMIVNDFCSSSALLCCVIVNVWSLESRMHIADRCAPREIANCAENLIFQVSTLSDPV